MSPERAIEEVKTLADCGVSIELIESDGQCYALARNIDAPAPPWSKPQFDILIVIPAAYDGAGLDGFYVELPCSCSGAEHSRIQGSTIEFGGRKWRLVSWHYPDGKPWTRGQDTIESHIAHCGGFFLDRGAVNAR
jgi:hypothetical protein